MSYVEETKNKLLAIGGDVANINSVGGDRICERIATDGVNYEKARKLALDEYGYGACHRNAIYHYYRCMPKLRVCTGYAMDKSTWYRHTWCVDYDGNIYECTPAVRKHYYGLPLSEEETKEFMEHELYPFEIEELEKMFAVRL